MAVVQCMPLMGQATGVWQHSWFYLVLPAAATSHPAPPNSSHVLLALLGHRLEPHMKVACSSCQYSLREWVGTTLRLKQATLG